jgi:hypothetical protein
MVARIGSARVDPLFLERPVILMDANGAALCADCLLELASGCRVGLALEGSDEAAFLVLQSSPCPPVLACSVAAWCQLRFQ